MKYLKTHLIWLRSKYCHLLFMSLFILKEEQEISTTPLAAQKANCNISLEHFRMNIHSQKLLPRFK